MKSGSKQVGALCFRRTEDGRTQILLVTSRETGRWVIPKGWPSRQLKDHRAAAREAAQEAGVSGTIRSRPIGSYTYLKRDGASLQSLQVVVFPLAVHREQQNWREQSERRRAWFSLARAAAEVSEPELRSLIRALGQSSGDSRHHAANAARLHIA
jgi:8-oxo-dGTP pyrophosphatase MutT (NUDIX family)